MSANLNASFCFATVDNFKVVFTNHPNYADATSSFNVFYGGESLPHPDQLFVDDELRNQLRPDFLDRIITQICEHIILPSARQATSTLSVILPLMKDKALIMLDNADPANPEKPAGNTLRRLNNKNLLSTLKTALAESSDTIYLMVDISHLDFDSRSDGYDFRDWSKMQTSGPYPSPSPRGSTPASSPFSFENVLPPPDIKPPPSGLNPAELLAILKQNNEDLLKATLQISQAKDVNPTGPEPQVTPTDTATIDSRGTKPPACPDFVNTKTLDPDVAARYENRYVAHGPLLGSDLRAPFLNDYYYSFANLHQLILPDGTLHVIDPEPKEKELLRANLRLTDTTLYTIRQWYSNLHRTCSTYRVYVHPFWCFRKDHGGARGFSCGEALEDDLPSLMMPHLTAHSDILYRLLSNPKMFPEGSSFLDDVTSSGGDGYVALRLIIDKAHPAFHPQPSIWLTSYPRQGTSMTVSAYFQVYKDFLDLKAYISDYSGTLHDPEEVDLFINGLRHREYVNRVSLDERRQSSLKHKYVGAQLVQTILSLLRQPDSPALRPRPSDAPAFRGNARGRFPTRDRPPRLAPVHAIDFDSASTPEALSLPRPVDINALSSIEVPPDSPDDSNLFDRYCTAIYRISAEPARASIASCLVCGAPHTFDDCPVLKNTAFLRSHYIRYCSAMKRELALRSALPEVNASDTARRVNAVEIDDMVDDSASVASVDSREDFCLGRA